MNTYRDSSTSNKLVWNSVYIYTVKPQSTQTIQKKINNHNNQASLLNNVHKQLHKKKT